MERKHIDRTKLIRIKTYADREGVTPQRIYQRANNDEITIVEIDGVKFVKVD